MKIKPLFKIGKEIIIISSCHICGRELRNPKSIALGVGPVCLARITPMRRTRHPSVLKSDIIPKLFDLEEEENVDQSRNRELPKS